MSLQSPLRRAVLGTLAATLCAAFPAVAQTYPNKTIRMVVPFPPGGGTDTMARMFAEKMAGFLGQPIIVDNKSGAATIIGTDAVAKAPADGYTIWFGPSSSVVSNLFFYPTLPYDPRRDLTLLYKVVSVPQVLVVHPSVKATNARELLAYVASHKGKVSYGSYGTGSYPHLAGAYMSQTQKADMLHIAYKGEAPLMVDLLGGNIQMTYASFMGVKQHVELGKLKAIGITGDHRVKTMANVPTLKEQGLDQDAYRLMGWLGMAVPAGTPAAVVNRLHEAIAKTAALPDIEKRVADMGYEVIKDSTPESFKASYLQELPQWKSLIETSGAKLE